MGLNTIGAVGVALPPPQALYPVTISNAPQIAGTNRISLPPGGDIIIPSGTWFVSTGTVSQLQALDPVTNTWTQLDTSDSNSWNPSVSSDGQNFRLYNPTGFAVGALVNNGGTGYTGTPTVSAGGGQGSSWQVLVGGAVSALNIVTGGSGANYSVPPIVSIAAPPTPGVQATAVANLSGGIVTSFTITNPGAGYSSAPAVVLVPQPTDVNSLAASTTVITNAKATAQLSYVGVITAILLTNEGSQPLTAPAVLTISAATGGLGSGATATEVMALTVTNITYTTGGSGYLGVTGGGPAAIGLVAFGGVITSAAAASNSNAVSNYMFIPEGFQAVATTSGGALSPAGWYSANYPNGIIDGGLYQQAPYIVPLQAGGGSGANLVPVMGSVNDTVFITPI